MRTQRTIAVLLLGSTISACASATVAGDSGPGTSSAASPPTDVTSAEDAWRQAAISDYTLDVKVTGCMACGQPLRYSVTVADGEVVDETVPPFNKPGAAPTVDELFKWVEHYGPGGSEVTYNDVGVPVEMHLDMPMVSDDQGDYQITFTPT
jgi:hypothetical protein